MGKMGEERQEEGEKHVNLNVGMKRASKFIADQMLEQRHLKVLHQILSTAWNRNGQVQSLSAAIALMGQYGVELPEEEVDRITSMEQDQQIAALVNRMPQDSNEQFQQFFLQLQLLVSTAMRVRDGLEDGTVEKVESALDDADSTGVTQHILRMAMVQAGNEATLQRQEYEAWVRETDEQMARLIRGQEDAMAAKKKLATLQARLQHDRDEHAEKASKVCMNFVTNSANSAKNACFQGWASWAKRAKQEGAIAKDYEDRLERIHHRLSSYRQSSLASMRSILDRKARAKITELMGEVLKLWQHVLDERKESDALSEQVEEMNSRLATAQGAQKETTRRVLERMNYASTMSLLLAAVEGWYLEVQDSKKQGDMQHLLAQAQSRLRAYLKGKNEASLKVLKMALGGCDTNIVTQAFACWKSHYSDAKDEAELEAAMRENDKVIQEYKSQHNKAAEAAMNRAARFYEENLLLEIFENWRMDSSVEGTVTRNQGKVDAKRQQLASVHQMFRSFVQQLESSLKKSVEAEKLERTAPLRRTRTLHKMDTGSVSLPDIHKASSPSRDWKAEVGQPRTAWG